jgi:polyphosphate kinase
MTRNLDKRIELMFPIENPEHKAKVLYALRAMFRDNVKAWILAADGRYRRKRPAPGEPRFQVQQQLQEDSRRAASRAREAAGIVFRPEQGAHTRRQ